MSVETKAALEAAIRAHIVDEYPDNLVSSWVLIAERVPPEDDDYTHVVDILPDGQSNVTTIGLAHFVTSVRSRAVED